MRNDKALEKVNHQQPKQDPVESSQWQSAFKEWWKLISTALTSATWATGRTTSWANSLPSRQIYIEYEWNAKISHTHCEECCSTQPQIHISCFSLLAIFAPCSVIYTCSVSILLAPLLVSVLSTLKFHPFSPTRSCVISPSTWLFWSFPNSSRSQNH